MQWPADSSRPTPDNLPTAASINPPAAEKGVPSPEPLLSLFPRDLDPPRPTVGLPFFASSHSTHR
ncbi:MAG: hypothetical protein EBT48_01265 [Verrucomicrobia bacterium]|nr:hypothetical protein [Verrucomicrobiota bacterium]